MKDSILKNIIYESAHQICVEIKTSEAYTGSAHHLAQRITDEVTRAILREKEFLEIPEGDNLTLKQALWMSAWLHTATPERSLDTHSKWANRLLQDFNEAFPDEGLMKDNKDTEVIADPEAIVSKYPCGPHMIHCTQDKCEECSDNPINHHGPYL
jgi:hypothetical protein